jgi:putative ABC transport system ATP-binding protein
MASPLIYLENVTKVYQAGEIAVHALREVSLTVEKGEFVAIMGPSGSGKSTLMNIIGCLDRPTSGRYFLDGLEVSRLSRNELAEIRNHEIGYVFQHFNLLPRTNALENVELPLIYSDLGTQERRARALVALERVGLADRVYQFPNQLSGGQQQRVAIARAVVVDPRLVLADEPTGNLDTRTSIEVMALFQQLRGGGITIVLVTHEPDIARYASRLVTLRDGTIRSDEHQAPQMAYPGHPSTQPSALA